MGASSLGAHLRAPAAPCCRGSGRRAQLAIRRPHSGSDPESEHRHRDNLSGAKTRGLHRRAKNE
jgi:hypothetical protein